LSTKNQVQRRKQQTKQYAVNDSEWNQDHCAHHRFKFLHRRHPAVLATIPDRRFTLLSSEVDYRQGVPNRSSTGFLRMVTSKYEFLRRGNVILDREGQSQAEVDAAWPCDQFHHFPTQCAKLRHGALPTKRCLDVIRREWLVSSNTRISATSMSLECSLIYGRAVQMRVSCLQQSRNNYGWRHSEDGCGRSLIGGPAHDSGAWKTTMGPRLARALSTCRSGSSEGLSSRRFAPTDDCTSRTDRIGRWCLLAQTPAICRATAPNGKVYAFEPTDYAFPKLQANIAANPDLADRIHCCQIMHTNNTDGNRIPPLYSSWPLGLGCTGSFGHFESMIDTPKLGPANYEDADSYF
jgi:hypothetical protein